MLETKVCLLYLVSCALHIYTIYLYIRLFFEGKAKSQKYCVFFYIIAYISNYIACTFIRIPLATLLINFIIIFRMTYQYHAKLQKRLLIVINTLAILLISELIVTVLLGYLSTHNYIVQQYISLPIAVLARIVSLIGVLLLKRFKHIRNEFRFSAKYWLALCIIPVSSIYLIFILLLTSDLGNMKIVFGLIFIMVIDLFAFYLYDVLNHYYKEKMEKVLLGERNVYYAERILSMKDSVQSVRKLQHDWKNHLIELGILIQQNEKEKALDYLEKVNGAIYAVKSFVNTGNMDVDGILNYKLQEAYNQGIHIDFQTNIPEEINISPFDCAIILGNLLDNAIEAAKASVIKKFIKGRLSFNKGSLFILLENSYAGNIQCKNDEIITTKSNKENHGLGLKNVKTAVEKYSGTLDLFYNASVFRVEIILYLG
ncbi:sensor histidine kinase [Anaerosacchariphilus polymeriproducens]|uniref:GHKL domain-containing protein n=1 Tax=Anaerosacchariphilus polymeriproducens TaxID=1812858 RepID=A0A371AY05_9FIRM|nr:sensor histidine kinase [Anaerosacchariphilus polymeriproducens]RDU24464.1 GHKL domain-containing protein [Anaerosacchariphilus polymeriproducens]